MKLENLLSRLDGGVSIPIKILIILVPLENNPFIEAQHFLSF
jgi:hypothetical protein